MSVLSLLLLLSCLGTPALAREAEDERLSETMSALARKGQWGGVERRYLELAEPIAADHLLGAHAARNRGDLAEVLRRLDAAIALGEADEAPAWRAELLATTRQVQVQGRSLVAVPAPFTPDAIATLALVNASLASRGAFTGRLMTGTYELDGQGVEVPAGTAPLNLEVDVAPSPAPLAVHETHRAPSPPTAPEPSTSRRPGRALLLGAAGGLLATSAGLYATGASRRNLWSSAEDVRDVHALRTETNRFTTLSGVTLGVAVGVGTLGVSLPAKDPR